MAGAKHCAAPHMQLSGTIKFQQNPKNGRAVLVVLLAVVLLAVKKRIYLWKKD